MKNQQPSQHAQFYGLSIVERQELVGEVINFGKTDSLVVELDEFSTQVFYDDPICMLDVMQYESEGSRMLSVNAISCDDPGFSAQFKPDININFSKLTEMIHAWAKRTNCRYINLHALEDYCLYLGAIRTNFY